VYMSVRSEHNGTQAIKWPAILATLISQLERRNIYCTIAR